MSQRGLVSRSSIVNRSIWLGGFHCGFIGLLLRFPQYPVDLDEAARLALIKYRDLLTWAGAEPRLQANVLVFKLEHRKLPLLSTKHEQLNPRLLHLARKKRQEGSSRAERSGCSS